MKKIYHLKTCDTNRQILKQIPKEISIQFEYQEIKSQPITVQQLKEMYNLTNSYEALYQFNYKICHK